MMSELEPTLTNSHLTATEVLRRLLDERGVEWTVPDESWNQDSITYWKVGSIKWVAFESENDTLWLNCNSVTDLTPAQAIASTLGPAYEPPVAAHWDGDVLTLTTTRDPSIIRVQRAEGQPLKVYRNVHELEVRWTRLLTLLRDEWDIDVAWDGLRRFWCVCLTAEGVRKRDEREAKVASSRGLAEQVEVDE